VDSGIKCVLVKTGKYREGDETSYKERPNLVVDSVGNIIDLLKN
jgi:ribonucleotide monophosphatase NagD (HAD superfamily)